MSDVDPLLRFISQHASDPDEESPAYKISVVVGGQQFAGLVVPPGPFLDSVLPTEELVSLYSKTASPDLGASAYLHLHVEKGPGVTGRQQRVVRFRMDSINAWWAE
ncbi:hypothetical protein [Streptomyces sp. NPDC126514]|uniref:hypothetical protein n=1 Tax=Streptomyces sp. NPDC126514 TaxID=3155210 RepID=UPI0033260784